MTLNNQANRDIIEMRRERVAQLRARQLSCREIAQALGAGDNPLLNPETGRPYGYAIIASDLKALKKEWAERRNAVIDEHIDRQFFEIEQIKRAGWAAKEPELALKALDREMKLLGTAKPQEFTLKVDINIVYQIIELAEAQGLKASDLFEGMLRRLQHANG
jgi:hypothetical protein